MYIAKRKILIISIFIILATSLIIGYVFLGIDRTKISELTKTVDNFESDNVDVAGFIKIGDKGNFCNEYYLDDKTGEIRIFISNNINGINLRDYVGKLVRISGTYEWTICLELCTCGPKIDIKTIK